MPRPKLEINPVKPRHQLTRVRLALQVYDTEQQYYRAADALVANLAGPSAITTLWEAVVRAAKRATQAERGAHAAQ
jgi:hypothetical protein